MNLSRQSNIELLRIVAILFVICHHILVHGMKIYSLPVSEYPWGYSLLNNLCYVGVNVFILISGYFTIKFSWKKLLHLYLMCFFVGVICYLAHCVVDGASIGRSLIYHNSIFAFSHHPLWYVLPYICLFLLSPFINKLLFSLSKQEYGYLIIVLLVISCYFGWFWQNRVNDDGYSLMQFVTMYAIGYYINKFDLVRKMRMSLWGIGFLVFSFMQTALVYLIMIRIGHSDFPPLPSVYSYNSPCLMIASVGLFCFFAKIDVQNRVINWVAKSTFGILLIHFNPFVWKWMIAILTPLFPRGFLALIAGILIIYLACLIGDHIVRYLFVYPAHRCVTWIGSKFSKQEFLKNSLS